MMAWLPTVEVRSRCFLLAMSYFVSISGKWMAVGCSLALFISSELMSKAKKRRKKKNGGEENEGYLLVYQSQIANIALFPLSPSLFLSLSLSVYRNWSAIKIQNASYHETFVTLVSQPSFSPMKQKSLSRSHKMHREINWNRWMLNSSRIWSKHTIDAVWNRLASMS